MSGLIRRNRANRRRRGFTLAEVLIATALSLLLMAAVVRLFAAVTSSVSDARAATDITQRLQSAQTQLQSDLRYATARGVPPLRPEDQEGYLEIIEGPGPFVITGFGTRPIKIDEGAILDASVGDMDDILMMTVRSFGEPFYGRWRDPVTNTVTIIQSQDAEIAWFVRGTKLHRRVRLITPGRAMVNAGLTAAADYNAVIGPGFARENDSSVRLDYTYGDRRLGQSAWNVFTANSLGDLTKRENRFGHDPYVFPYDARFWGPAGLPTHGDTSHVGQNPGLPVVPEAAPWTQPMPWGFAGDDPLGNAQPPTYFPYPLAVDYWLSPYVARDLTGAVVGSPIIDSNFGALLEYRAGGPINNNRAATGRMYLNADATTADAAGGRYSEDVVLSDVIGFDIKVWDSSAPVFIDTTSPLTPLILPGDPGYIPAFNLWVSNGELASDATLARFGAYVDLFYTRSASTAPSFPSQFAGPGLAKSGLSAGAGQAAVYDTWSTHYEQDGVDQFTDNVLDLAYDGIDNDNANGVDDLNERETLPPYPAALRSIQIKIRVYEPDSQQIREVTVAHDFIH